MSGGAARNPNSLANLRPEWKPGQSGNPRGRRPGHHSPEARLRKLLADGLTERAERLLWNGIARFEPWAWSLVWPPPPPTWVSSETGEELEPSWAALPPSPAWTMFAGDLARYAARHPYRVPSKLWAAIGQ